MKYFIIVCGFILSSLQLGAQTHPIKWDFKASKETANTYNVYLAATVESPWHIYSQTTPAGGPLATKISYGVNPLINVTGKVEEQGQLKTIHDKNFGVDVKYFSGNVKFVQTIKLKTAVKTSLHGTIEYMVCNDI
jgi:thiol:disulfide interchange protein DsbD